MNEIPLAIPPLLKRPKSLGWAAALNFVLPGAGLFYLGRRMLGALLAVPFLICLVGALGVFLIGYVHYLNTVLADDLMKEGQLEQLLEVFHNRWLTGLGLAGLALQIISMIVLAVVRKKPLPAWNSIV